MQLIGCLLVSQEFWQDTFHLNFSLKQKLKQQHRQTLLAQVTVDDAELPSYSATRPTVATQTKFLTSFVQVSQSDSEIVFEWAAASSMRIELQLIFDRKTTDSATDFYNKDIYTARNIKSKSEP